MELIKKWMHRQKEWGMRSLFGINEFKEIVVLTCWESYEQRELI